MSEPLLDLHVRALFTHDARGRILRIDEPGGGGPAPRFYLGGAKTGCVLHLHATVG